MAAVVVATEDEPMAEELRQDQTHLALQVAVVSGFVEDSRAVQESCLGLCNACRDGVPVECILIQEEVPLSLLSVVVPSGSRALDGLRVTRVLQPRRVLKVRFEWHEQFPDIPTQTYVANLDLANVKWPEGIEEVQFALYDQALERVVWPKSLERLSFYSHGSVMHVGESLARFPCSPLRGLFNHPLQGVSFPSGLREIFLGNSFDQPIEDVAWPVALERLSLPGFNHSIDNLRWPPRLVALEFLCPSQIQLRKKEGVRAEELDNLVQGFNRPFTTLPASLETLWLSNAFAQDSLAGIAWPPRLTTLGLGKSFGAALVGRVSWPPGIRHVYSTVEIDLDDMPARCVVTVVRDYDTESQSHEADDYDEEEDFEGHWNYSMFYGSEDDEFFDNIEHY